MWIRGVAKVVFILFVIAGLLALAFKTSREFFAETLEINFYFIKQAKWLRYFFGAFFIFFSLHILMLLLINQTGYLRIVYSNPMTLKILGSLALGFIATFFLAWSEELIFRGILFRYLNRLLLELSSRATTRDPWTPAQGRGDIQEVGSIYVSIFITSSIFMFSHKLEHSLQLGLGLFLVGVVLNLLFVTTGKLYVSMGAHAGLVFVKVILRRTHWVEYLPSDQLPWWLAVDLRQSYLTHFVLLFLILVLNIHYHRVNLPAIGKPLFRHTNRPEDNNGRLIGESE